MDQLWRYYLLLLRRNPDLDLVAKTGLREVALKHFLDSAIVPDLVALPSPLLDIGSGAGFPGVVLKIMRPDLALILAEERVRKAAYLRELIAELGLGGVEVFPHRVTSSFPMQVAGAISRAVESVGATLVRCRGFLVSGGQVILMKGPAVDRELRDVQRRARGAYVLRADHAYALPGTAFRRRILVYERCGVQ